MAHALVQKCLWSWLHSSQTALKSLPELLVHRLCEGCETLLSPCFPVGFAAPWGFLCHPLPDSIISSLLRHLSSVGPSHPLKQHGIYIAWDTALELGHAFLAFHKSLKPCVECRTVCTVLLLSTVSCG